MPLLLKCFVLPPLGRNAVADFCFRVALNVGQNPRPSPIRTSACNKFTSTSHLVAEGARIERIAGIVGAVPTVYLTKDTIPEAGKDAKAEIAHDVFNPAVAAIGSEAHGFCHAFGGRLAPKQEGFLGTSSCVLKECVASGVVNAHIVGVTATSAASTVRHNFLVVVGFIV